MRNILALVFFSISFLSITKAQTTKESIDTMNNKFRDMACTDIQAAMLLYADILEQLREIDYPYGEITALGNYAYFKYCQNELDSSLFYFKKATGKAAESKEYAEQANMSKNTGNIFIMQGVYDSSLFYLNKGLKISMEHNDSTYLGSIQIGLGIVYQNLGELEKAMEAYLEAEKVSKKMNDLSMQVHARLNRYTILSDHYPEKLSKKDFLATQEICQKNDLKHSEATLLQFLGDMEKDSSNFEQALVYFNRGIDLSITTGRLDLKLYHIEGAAYCYLEMGDYTKATQLANEAIAEAEPAGFTPNLVQLYLLKAQSLFKLKHHKEVVEAANKSIEAAESSNQKEVVYEAYGYLAGSYAALGDFKKAYMAQSKYTELSKAILDEKKSEQLTELQTKYETEKIEAEKVLAENRADLAESESQRNLLLFAGALVIVVLIILATLFYNSKLKQSKKAEIALLELKASQKQLALEKQYRDSELKALKAQMNPHFIFNVLNSIQDFIIMNQKELASDYLATFAELIRSYLHFSNKGFISLQEETEALQKYLELEALRFGDGFTYQVGLGNNLQPEDFKIPTMIIQPFVENAIKHGLFSKKGEKKLTVDFTGKEKGVIECTITDNGIGREAARKIKASKPGLHKSFAMEAIASRLELFNQRMHNKISVEIIDLFDEEKQASGTQVKLIIPSQS